MLIPLGILGASGGAAGAFELISTTVLGSDAASVTFSNLGNFSSVYTSLQIRYAGKTAGTSQEFRLAFNGVGSGYPRHLMRATSSSSTASGNANLGTILFDGGLFEQTGTTNHTPGIIDIFDPYDTSKNTTVRQISGEAFFTNQIYFHTGMFTSTASVTSITISSGNNLQSASRFSLYGIK